VKRDVWKLPNLLSLTRISLIPVFLYFFLRWDGDGYPYAAVLTLAFSFATDVLDGFIARRYSMITELGKLLDPLADKITQTAVIYAVCMRYGVPFYILAFFVSKELLMAAGALYLRRIIKGSIIPSNYWGKTATGCFYVSVAAIMLHAPYDLGLIGLYITVVLMICAFVSYSLILVKLKKAS